MGVFPLKLKPAETAETEFSTGQFCPSPAELCHKALVCAGKG